MRHEHAIIHHRALDFWSARLRGQSGLDGLEIGAGAGGLSLWLALNGHRVTCSDRSDVARASAALDHWLRMLRP